MIAGAVHLRTAGQPRSDVVGLVEYLAVFMLIGLSLFWAANDYAAAVGRSRAAQFVRKLPSYPEAIVYSEHDLNLTGIDMVSCADSDAAYGSGTTGWPWSCNRTTTTSCYRSGGHAKRASLSFCRATRACAWSSSAPQLQPPSRPRVELQRETRIGRPH
jgi:hypothetical protein